MVSIREIRGKCWSAGEKAVPRGSVGVASQTTPNRCDALLHALTHPSYSAWNEDLQVEEDDQVERVVDRTSLDGKIRAVSSD